MTDQEASRLAEAAIVLTDAFNKLSEQIAELKTGTSAEDKFVSQLAMALFDALEVVIVVDEQGKIVLINSGAELLTGYHRAALRGEFVELLIPEDNRLQHANAYRPYYMLDPHIRAMGGNLTLRLRRRGGTKIPVDIRLAPVVTENGTFVIASIRRLAERPKGAAISDETEEKGNNDSAN